LKYGGADFERLRTIYTELGFTRMIASIPMQTPTEGGVVPTVVSCRAVHTVDALVEIATKARERRAIAISIDTTAPEAMRAQLVGIGLSTAAGEGCYVPITHRYIGVPKQLTLDEVRAALAPVFSDPQVRKIGYDLKYIDVVLAAHGMPLSG